MLRKLVCGSRLLHPIHGRGAFQRSNIISNLAVPLTYQGVQGEPLPGPRRAAGGILLSPPVGHG